MSATDKLPKFERNRPLQDEITAERMNLICDAIRENRVEAGENTKIRRTVNGQLIDAIIPKSKVYHPFQVVVDYTEGAWRAAIMEGSLLLTMQPNLNQAITGLTLLTDSSPSWRPLLPTDFIWLELAVDASLGITTAVIKSDGDGDTGEFDPTIAAWSSDEAYLYGEINISTAYREQTVSRTLIAYTVPDENDETAPVLTQVTDMDLMLQSGAVGGTACVVPVPWFGIYTAP